MIAIATIADSGFIPNLAWRVPTAAKALGSQIANLAPLPWFPFTVEVSADTEIVAGRIAQRCERAFWLLRDALRYTPRLKLLVLSPADWPTYAGATPYGEPRFSRDGMMLLPSDGAAATADSAAFVERLAGPFATRALKQVYGERSGRLDLATLAELQVVRTLAHVFQSQAGVRFPRHWLEDLFGMLCLITVTDACDTDSRRLIDALPQALLPSLTVDGSDQVAPHTLADYERALEIDPNSLSLPSRFWYRSQFTLAASRIYQRDGIAAVARLFEVFTRVRRPLSDGDLAHVLRDRVSTPAAQMLLEWPQPEFAAPSAARQAA